MKPHPPEKPGGVFGKRYCQTEETPAALRITVDPESAIPYTTPAFKGLFPENWISISLFLPLIYG